MTTRTLTLAGLGALTLAIAGCSGSGKSDNYKPKAQEKITPVTIVPGKEADLFPAKAGNTWVFAGETNQTTPQGSRSQQAEITFRITDVADTPAGKVATIEISTDGTLSDRLKWRVGPDGIYQVSGSMREKKDGPLKDVPFNPPVPIVPFPIKQGSEISAKSSGVRPVAGVGAFENQILTEGIQEVDSDMGRFSALSTSSTSTYTEKNIKFQAHTGAFWSPNVGIVRYIQEVTAMNPEGKTINSTTVLRLKSHTP